MRRILRVIRVTGVAAVIAAGLGGLTASAQAVTRTITVSVVGIDRHGSQVAVQPTIVPLSGNAEASDGPAYTLVPGTYFVGASVPTMTNGSLASQTIVEQRMRITASGTLSLDARGGKLVSVWLNGRDLGSPAIAGGCIRGGRGVVYPEPPAPLLFVKPVSAAQLGFDWAISEPGPDGSSYDLAGGTKTGVPASPAYRLQASGLARTVIVARAGTVPDQTATVSTSSTAADGCMLPGASLARSLPARTVLYRTPGQWNTEVDTRHDSGLMTCSMTWVNQKYRARRSYTVPFETAAHGPDQAVPVVVGTALGFSPNYQFSDPQTQGYEYCGATTVSLSHDGRELKALRFTNLVGSFTAKVATHGWYVLRVAARQTAAAETMPAALLSPRTTLTWRFKITQGAEPVAVMSFLPQGLNLSNEAAPGSVTKIRAWSTQNAYVFAPGPASAARTFTVQVSYNDGSTWHPARVARHKGFWMISVRNPGSGFVALRSTTVNSAGDSSVQTIYRAYRIG